MKKGSILLIVAGYLAGMIAVLKFNKKSPVAIKNEMNSDDAFKNLGKNILEIHKNIFESMEASVFSDANKARISEYEQKLIKELHVFEKDALAQLKIWKSKGIDKKDEIEQELQNIYNKRIEILETLQKDGIELIEDAKSEGNLLLDEGKKIANKVFKDVKKHLDTMYSDIKKQLVK